MDFIYFITDNILVYLAPIILFTLGFWLKKRPVKKISSSEGYCSPYAQSSQETWTYAQNIAPRIMIKVAVISSVFITLFQLVTIENYIEHKTIATICENSWIIILPTYFIIVEGLLRYKFDVKKKTQL